MMAKQTNETKAQHQESTVRSIGRDRQITRLKAKARIAWLIGAEFDLEMWLI